MTANKTSATTANDTHVSPFEQISQLETIQEQRVIAANEKCMTEENEAEKTIALAEQEQEEALKKKANEELKQYLQSEPATILQEHEKETNEEVQSINTAMSSQLVKKAESLVADFVKNPSYFLSA